MKFLKTLIAASTSALMMGAAMADDFPSKPIHLIVPLSPGGGGDMAARVVAEGLARELDTSVVVENRPGASSTIGTQAAARSEADGYTLILVTDFHAINEALNRLDQLDPPLPYDSLADFDTVGQVLSLQVILLASADTGITDMESLIAKAKQTEGGLSAATPGIGSPHNLAFLQMAQMGDFPLLTVPFNGSGPATTAAQGGQVDLVFAAVGPGVAMADGGRVNAIAVSSDTRDPAAPDVPTIEQTGFDGFSIESWMGILAPKGVPAERLDLLNRALVTVLEQPEVIEKITKAGMYPTPGSRQDFLSLIETDIEKNQAIFKNSPLSQ